MSRLIDADALKANVPDTSADIFENCRNCKTLMDWQVKELIDQQPTVSPWHRVEEELPTIDAVPVKFIDEVIEYLTKCRDYAIHEETKTTWDEQRQTLIMLLHEWAAWNECGRTGKYGERREG